MRGVVGVETTRFIKVNIPTKKSGFTDSQEKTIHCRLYVVRS